MLFTYRDSKGVLSRRKLTHFRDDGTYIRGFCQYSNGLRTFRKDRIEQEFSDESDPAFLAVPIQQSTPKSSKPTENYLFEICFTGFDKQTSAELKAVAEANKLQVRSSVTKALDFLCIGPNAGPKKLEKAEDQGATIITQDQFSDLVDDGLLPESWEPREDKQSRWDELKNPDTYFADWKFRIIKAHWPALGVRLREFTDDAKTEALREKWKKKNPRYTELEPKFFNKNKELIQDEPELPEWNELYEAHSKQVIKRLAYAQSVPAQYAFEVGDLFWKNDNKSCLQVIAIVGEKLEVKQMVKTVDKNISTGFLIDNTKLVQWLKSGKAPDKKFSIHKNQSQSEIAKYYEYT